MAALTTGATIEVTLVQTLFTPKFPTTECVGVKESGVPFKEISVFSIVSSGALAARR